MIASKTPLLRRKNYRKGCLVLKVSYHGRDEFVHVPARIEVRMESSPEDLLTLVDCKMHEKEEGELL